MESYKSLISAHVNCKKLEKEIKKERHNLIKEYLNKNSSDSNWFITKIKYTGFAQQLKKETVKFDKLLEELDNNDNNIDTNISLSSDGGHSEIMNNFANDPDSDSSSSNGSEKEYHVLLRNSVPITDNGSIDEAQINMETEETEEKKEMIVSNDIVTNEEKEAVVMNNNPDDLNKSNYKFVKSDKEYPSLGNTESINDMNDTKNKREAIKVTKYAKRNRTNKISLVTSGYKYGGKGFRVFTGPRNRGKPIFSQTMLYCYETCNKNKVELKKFLIKFGKFKEEMIENIIFKDGYNNDYALVGVRGPLKIIKKKIKTLNKSRNYQCIRIFERSKVISVTDYINASNILYVNNFDLLKVSDHKNMTKLFLRFGELLKDIKMGCDKNGDPYGIVTFRSQDDAIRCFDDKNLMYNGKNLQIRFSKF
mmetsp:Transcript_26591/g.23411  ORF Transcript_26591/g.23411 Transcript_26591/m.23411 type:complete len:421 (+) Transcript_26591:164-1426(+)